jgi:hypothetical protein
MQPRYAPPARRTIRQDLHEVHDHGGVVHNPR